MTEITGDHLRALREKNNWTQEQLAGVLAVSTSSVTRWEHDEKDDSPNGTAYLVLIPMLLGAGIELKLEPDTAGMATLNYLRAQGILDQAGLQAASDKLALQPSLQLCGLLSKAVDTMPERFKAAASSNGTHALPVESQRANSSGRHPRKSTTRLESVRTRA